MENEYFLIQKIACDPDKMPSRDGMRIVSFRIEVLDKYSNNPDYVIHTPQSVGTLKSQKQNWQLQIDVHEYYVNTWLYKLGDLPEDEQAHFSKFNIYPKELSKIAYNRWIRGLAE